jgi:hypothetical protein
MLKILCHPYSIMSQPPNQGYTPYRGYPSYPFNNNPSYPNTSYGYQPSPYSGGGGYYHPSTMQQHSSYYPPQYISQQVPTSVGGSVPPKTGNYPFAMDPGYFDPTMPPPPTWRLSPAASYAADRIRHLQRYTTVFVGGIDLNIDELFMDMLLRVMNMSF